MPRAKKGIKARRRRNRILKWAKGYRGKRGNCYKSARETVQHAWSFMYRHRRERKGDFRRLWIIRINAAARTLGVSYSKLIGALAKAGISLDRKMLATLAVSDPAAFRAVALQAKAISA
ncbi:MAG: 50S ribosomal protein L20 [Deltaproteobacteria bacterium]|nr:50S ribosomal protein L20 [Deltaproteobacteria bacterium]